MGWLYTNNFYCYLVVVAGLYVKLFPRGLHTAPVALCLVVGGGHVNHITTMRGGVKEALRGPGGVVVRAQQSMPSECGSTGQMLIAPATNNYQ